MVDGIPRLTLVSVMFQGQRYSQFMICQTVNGKPHVSVDAVNKMLTNLGCVQRGQTFSVGA